MQKMHSHYFVLVEAVWFIFFRTGITAPITQAPSNTVAEIGNQVELNCSVTSDPIDYWYFSKDGIEANELTIVGSGCLVKPPFSDHYDVDLLGGGKTCNLIVFNITMEQAGVYRCEEIPEYASSILTVIDSPVVTVNTTEPVVEKEKVIITCSLSYEGSVAPAPTLRPYFYWKDFNGKNVSSSYDSTTETTAVSQLTVKADADKNITSYTCHVYFQLVPPDTAYYANNIPTANSSASSPTIEVLYGAYVYGYSHPSEFIAIGGITCEIKVLTCHAHGNPPPSVEWFDTEDNVSITKETTFDLAEINRKYTCVTNNTIRSVVYSDSLVIIGNNRSIIEDCRFPHSESTWISATPVEGCDNETCDCSSGNGGFTFLCNADSYPGALYQWIGADNSVIDSQVYASAQINGMYHCTAYFDRSSSNYTGNYIFPKGTNKKNVIECFELTETDSSSSDVAIAMGVLFCISFVVNIIFVIWVYNHQRAKEDQFKRTENAQQPEKDLSNGTSAPPVYEELRRPDETRMQQSTYEKLRPNPAMHSGPIIPKTGLGAIHNLNQDKEHVNAK